MLRLPDVTLVLVDDVAHRMARAALEDTLRLIEPRHIATFSSDMVVSAEGLRNCYTFVQTKLKTAQEADTCLWHRAWTQCPSSHMLVIQWDGWVLDPNCWRREFLQFDYIGAPWPWHADRRVGNGGFSLRSVRLMRFLAENAERFPVKTPEDDTLCRIYRPELERAGFRWAPEAIADKFSFERGKPVGPTFGFHGIFNMRKVIKGDANERLFLMGAYERDKTEWRETA